MREVYANPDTRFGPTGTFTQLNPAAEIPECAGLDTGAITIQMPAPDKIGTRPFTLVTTYGNAVTGSSRLGGVDGGGITRITDQFSESAENFSLMGAPIPDSIYSDHSPVVQAYGLGAALAKADALSQPPFIPQHMLPGYRPPAEADKQ